MKHNTFSVIFYLRRYKTASNGKTPIYARITVDGKRMDISVKRSIEEVTGILKRDWPGVARKKSVS